MYKRILLTLDGSPLARAATPHAAALAAGTDCEVIVLQVIDAMETTRLATLPEAYESGRSAKEVAEGTQFAMRSEAEEEVARATAQLAQAGVLAVRGLVREGLPGNVILDVAEGESVDAVIMATRGHSGLGREVTGSVAEYVLRHAGPIAVMMVGPRTRPEAAGDAIAP